MIVLAGSGCSFDEAERNLKELCRLSVSNDVVRRVCNEEGEAIRKWMNRAPEMKQAFDAADGVVEFSTDGLTVNTTEGWREIRQSVIAKRRPALPARGRTNGTSGPWTPPRCAWRHAASLAAT